MKNILYTFLIGAILTLVGCQKEDIQPRTNSQSDATHNCPTKKGGENDNSFTDTRPDNPNITDPNRDEDDEERIKRE